MCEPPANEYAAGCVFIFVNWLLLFLLARCVEQCADLRNYTHAIFQHLRTLRAKESLCFL